MADLKVVGYEQGTCEHEIARITHMTHLNWVKTVKEIRKCKQDI